MLNNSTPNENLLSYLDKELDETNKLKVEEALQNSESLQIELNDLIITKYTVQHYGLKEQIASIHENLKSTNELKTTTPVKKLNYWKPLSIAVAAIALLALIISNLYTNKTTTVEELYASNYKSYTTSNTRGNSLNDIEQNFAAKKYDAIIQQFNNNPKITIEEQFYLALSQYEKSDLNASISNLQLVIQNNVINNTINHKDDAEYYLGMAYLKQKNVAKSIEIFEKIANNKKHLYSDIINESFMQSLYKLK